MKISNFQYHIFAIIFFAFALVVTTYMSAHMTEEGYGSQQLLTYIFLLLDLVCFAIFIQCMNRRINGIHVVCILWVIIMPIFMFFNNQQISNTVRVILWPLLFEGAYLCFRFSVSRGLLIKKMMFIVAIVGAYFFLRTRSGAEHQTNTIFLVFLTLPWLLFESKKTTQLIVLGVFTFFAMVAMKRSILLMTVLIWFFYFFVGMKNRRNRIITIIVSVMVVVSVYVLFEKVNVSMGGLLGERIMREETDTGRNRIAIWNLTYEMIQKSSREKIIIGHGHYGVRHDSPLEISAHNDFLEIIYDYGLIIFILYLFLWRLVIRRTYYLYKNRSSLFIPYSASLSIFIVGSMVSHLVLYTSYFNYLVVLWAMIEAMADDGTLNVESN